MFGSNNTEKAYTLFSENVISLLANDLRLGRGTFYDQICMYSQATPYMRKSQTSRIFSRAVDTIGKICSDSLEKYKLNTQQTDDFSRRLRDEFLPLLKSYYKKIADKYFPSKIPPEAFQTDGTGIIEILTKHIHAGNMKQYFSPTTNRYTKQYVDVPAYHQKRFSTEFAEMSAEKCIQLLEPGVSEEITNDIVSFANLLTIAIIRDYYDNQLSPEMQEGIYGWMEMLAGDLADAVGVPDFEGDNMLFNALANMPEYLIKSDLAQYYGSICKPKIQNLFTDLIAYSLGKDYPQLYSDRSFMQIVSTRVASLAEKLTSRLADMRMDDYRYFYYEANLQ